MIPVELMAIHIATSLLHRLLPHIFSQTTLSPYTSSETIRTHNIDQQQMDRQQFP